MGTRGCSFLRRAQVVIQRRWCKVNCRRRCLLVGAKLKYTYTIITTKHTYVYTRTQIICIPFFSVSYVILPQMDFLLFDLRFNTYFCFTSMLTHLLFDGYISSFFSVAIGISRKEAIRMASVVEASFLENNERNGLAEEELSGRSTLAPFCPAPKECKRSAGHESSASRPKR